MKKLFVSLLVPALLTLCSCGKGAAAGEVTYRTVQVELNGTASATSVAYTTDAGDTGTAAMVEEGRNSISGPVKVSDKATKLWCYTPDITIPSQITVSEPSLSVEGMGFCTPAVTLSQKTSYTTSIKPLTAGVVLDITDSKGIWTGKDITSVTIQTADEVSLAGKVTVNLQEGRIGEVKDASASIRFVCTGIQVGTSASPASLAAMVLPCSFTGTVTVEGEGFSGTLNVTQAVVLQAGTEKHITVDLDKTRGGKGFPRKLAIIGDSISTFEGVIPSSHRKYYPTDGCDVDEWTKTYWGHLINDYWHCELDVNTSWSGSSVASGKEGSVRTPFVDDSRLSLLKNPDCVILFGGTNDAIDSNGIGLGEFCYDTPLAQINHNKRFRDAYIYVIKYIQGKFPDAQIICIIGTDITGDYGTSVEAIAKHYGLPTVDFRGEKKVAGKVTIFSGSHPDAAGHAYKAKKIYEQTLDLFQ